MKKYFISMMLLPALAMAESGELARCEQTFRDNMDIMAFPMYCTPSAPPRPRKTLPCNGSWKP